MEFEVSYTLENEQQFWDELDDIVRNNEAENHALIDNKLRSYLSFTSKYQNEYLISEYDVARCSCRLLESTLFETHKDYVRRQFIYCLLQEDAPNTLRIVASFLLIDGRQHDATFEMMNSEGVFPRLVELLQSFVDEDLGLYRLLLELMYEMSRIQRVKLEDLMLIQDDFVCHLFQTVEQLSDDVDDPYHYPVIRVLLVLNEQYMVAAHDPIPDESDSSIHLTNRVIKVLSVHGQEYKTFGENIILLLNRESETSLQLLTLKLLYLLFTTPPTAEYFYTNDLHVLIDIIIRNLLDLPTNALPLRHTYLRVLHPLLAHTQLRIEPHYKRTELLKLLALLAGSETAHFAPTDETTVRLVRRCASVSWLCDDDDAPEELKRLLENKNVKLDIVGRCEDARASATSVAQVASQTAKPGELTGSRLGMSFDMSAHEPVPTASGSTQDVSASPKQKHKKLPPKRPPERRGRRKKPTSEVPTSS